ncbi:MAG: hydrogenase iron-sulfur subunit [Fibrobacteria bacterium]|nr:hydrogenase iron-sulfur subunit [Fibrobacteria bacterium]
MNTATETKSLNIAILYCKNCISGDKSIHLSTDENGDFTVKPVMLPCSSNIQAYQLLRILDKEADGIELVACPGTSCEFMVGSCRAGKRVSYVRELLEKINVNPGRIGVSYTSNASVDDLLEIAANRAKAVNTLNQ